MMLTDTSVWIDHFNLHDSRKALCLPQALSNNESVVLSGIVLFEILMGLRSKKQAGDIENLMTAFDWLPEPGHHDYAQAAQIFRHCRSQGIAIRSTIDCLIASQCIRHHVPILTKDRDFPHIAIHHPLTLVTP